VVVKSVVILSY